MKKRGISWTTQLFLFTIYLVVLSGLLFSVIITLSLNCTVVIQFFSISINNNEERKKTNEPNNTNQYFFFVVDSLWLVFLKYKQQKWNTNEKSFQLRYDKPNKIEWFFWGHCQKITHLILCARTKCTNEKLEKNCVNKNL